MSGMEMAETLSRGHFWLNNPDLAVAGELKYSRLDGTNLYLFGVLDDTRPLGIESFVRYPCINGWTEGLGHVYLLDALLERQQLGNRPTASSFHSDLMIASKAAGSFSSASLLKLSASVDSFHEWLGISGFSFEFPSDLSKVRFSFNLPDKLQFDAGDFKLEFEFGREGPTMRPPQKEAAISQMTWMSLTFNEPTPLDLAREKLRIVTDLVALGVGRPLTWPELEGKFAVASTEARGLWAKVFGRALEPNSGGDVRPFQMLFTYDDVRGRFQDVLTNWLAIADETRPLYELYFATTRANHLHVEHRLFNYFQGLESYHRTKNELSNEEKDRVKSLKAKMLSACSDKEQQWLQERLHHLGEPSAAERIKDLILKFNAEWIFLPDWLDAVRRIKNLRNYFTHYSKEPPQAHLGVASMYNDGSRLQVLCEQIFLVEIGFSPKEATTLLQRKRRLQSLMVH